MIEARSAVLTGLRAAPLPVVAGAHVATGVHVTIRNATCVPDRPGQATTVSAKNDGFGPPKKARALS
jgi:hypothetical protein